MQQRGRLVGSGYFGGIYFGEYGNQVEADPAFIDLEASSDSLQTFDAAREPTDFFASSTDLDLEASR